MQISYERCNARKLYFSTIARIKNSHNFSTRSGDMESDWVVTEGPLQQKTFHCHFTQSVTSVDTESVTKI